MKNLSTRDALLALRKVVSVDAERAEQIQELTRKLGEAIGERAEAISDALSTLEDYVHFQSEIHGFNSDLEAMVASASPQTAEAVPAKRSSTKKKKKATKKKVTKKKVTKKQKRSGGRNGGPQKAVGWNGTLDEDINLSEREQEIFDVLADRWPTFTTPQTLVKKGLLPANNHATAKVNQMRRKGVPIESARQARVNDPELSPKTRGYRLITA